MTRRSETRSEQRRRERVEYLRWAAEERARREEDRTKPGALDVPCAECPHPRRKHRLKMLGGLLLERCAAHDDENYETGLCGCDLFEKEWSLED
jgi:hypothetical protein